MSRRDGRISPESRDPARARWDAAIAVAAAGFFVAYSYGPIAPIDGLPALTLTWQRALAVFALLVVARHVEHPRPSLPAVISARIRQRLLPDGSRFVLTVAIASRLLVVAMGLATVLWFKPLAPDIQRVSESAFWNLPARWDAYWYLTIAESGYSWTPGHPEIQSNLAFFPAHPILMRLAGDVVTMPAYWLRDASIFGGSAGSRLLFGGWILSMVAFVWGLAVVYALARDDLGETRACWAVLLLAAFPFAFFFSAPYTEGLFLLSVASAFLAARQARPLPVFCWGLVAALTRQTGVTVALPLAILALLPIAGLPDLRDRRSWPKRGWLLAASLGPVVGLSLHLAYLWVQFGDPFLWVKAQDGWYQSTSAFPFVMERLSALQRYGLVDYFRQSPGPVVGTFVPYLALALLWRTWIISPAYAAFVVVTLVPAVGIDTPSIGRMGAPLFPLFIAMAALLPNRWTAWGLAAAFGAAQLWAASVFFSWGRLY